MPDQPLTDRIVAEVRRRGSTRGTIAAVYREGLLAMLAELRRDPNVGDTVDWRTVNGAILERYSMAGLLFIKQLAWKDTSRKA